MRPFMIPFAFLLLTACQPVASTPAATLQERVIASGKIRCGYFDWEPLLTKDVNAGHFTGIAADMMDEITSRLGLTYEWSEEVGPSTAVQSLQSERVDMICLPVIITHPRMRVADFSDPVLYSRFGVWMRADDTVTDTASLNDASKKFVAIDGTAPMAMTKRLFPQVKMLSLTELSPTSDMFLSVVTKKADAVYSDTSNAGMFARHNPNQIRLVSDPDTDRLLPWALMTPQGETEFTRMIDLVLQDMQLDGTIAKIVRKHSAEKMYFPVTTRVNVNGF